MAAPPPPPHAQPLIGTITYAPPAPGTVFTDALNTNVFVTVTDNALLTHDDDDTAERCAICLDDLSVANSADGSGSGPGSAAICLDDFDFNAVAAVATDVWKCATCTFDNSNADDACTMCEAERPGNATDVSDDVVVVVRLRECVGHYFHRECVEAHVERTRRCPVCSTFCRFLFDSALTVTFFCVHRCQPCGRRLRHRRSPSA
jgi:hypothetical protein